MMEDSSLKDIIKKVERLDSLLEQAKKDYNSKKENERD